MNSERVEARNAEVEYIESTLLGIQELKNNLVTQIAHNFRTPLTSVIGFAEMLLDDRPLTDEQRIEYARFIQYEGIRLSKLIDDVLALSSLERGDAQLKIRSHVLQEIVAEAVATVAEFARGRFVQITQSFENQPLTVQVDREKIIQAIYQLLHNAVRFTGSNDNVTVSVRVAGDAAAIEVKDCGPGIPEEEIASLVQAHKRTFRPEQDMGGVGIGLAIVQNIMDLHNGRIEIRSTVGDGSTFTLWIPCVED